MDFFLIGAYLSGVDVDDLFTWYQNHPLGSSFASYLSSSPPFFLCGLPMYLIPCWIRLATLVALVSNFFFGALFGSVKVLLAEINCATTSFSEEAASAKLSSRRANYSCSSEE